jgi:hypothetical protein
MARKTSVPYAALVVLVSSTVALVGCGHSSSSKSGTSSGSASGKCATGYVSGTVAGQSKCLQNGQQCQDQNASDYKKYGFTCSKNNGRYELKKK